MRAVLMKGKPGNDMATLYVNASDISSATGQKRSNVTILKKNSAFGPSASGPAPMFPEELYGERAPSDAHSFFRAWKSFSRGIYSRT